MTDAYAVIIDDSEMSVKVLGSLLEMSNTPYTTIHDPRRAREVLTTLPHVDVVFLDLEMPHLSGMDVLHLIKQELGLQIPVVAYTVHTSEIDVARHMGFDGFLGKPLNMRTFSSHLENILKGVPVWSVY